MADSIKDNSNSTGATPIVSTDSSTSLNNGINPASSQATTSADGTTDDKKDNSTSDGTSSTTNIDVKTNVTSSSTIESVPSQTDAPINNTIISKAENSTTNPAIKYSIEDLIENSKALTGHKKEVAVGALFNCNEKELTKESFKKLVEDFLQRKVK